MHVDRKQEYQEAMPTGQNDRAPPLSSLTSVPSEGLEEALQAENSDLWALRRQKEPREELELGELPGYCSVGCGRRAASVNETRRRECVCMYVRVTTTAHNGYGVGGGEQTVNVCVCARGVCHGSCRRQVTANIPWRDPTLDISHEKSNQPTAEYLLRWLERIQKPNMLALTEYSRKEDGFTSF